jgi:hypothetical protein
MGEGHHKSLPGELWGVATFFNPTGSPILRENLALFSHGVRGQGIKLLVAELAFGDKSFEVPDKLADVVLRWRSDTVLWHKERLLNLGIEHLPRECDKVVWLDADILFENLAWVEETRRLLETYVVLQPYDTACWLPCGTHAASPYLSQGLGGGQSMRGMAFTLTHCHNRRRVLADYFEHGHSGFAWAMRRDVLDHHRLYDRRILGGGDIVIAHAIYGDRDFWRGRNVYCRHMTKKELASIADWSWRLDADVQGRVGYVPGRVLHLWHGELAQRHYVERLRILKENDFDPAQDVALDALGCWRWNSDKPNLHRRVRDYFAARGSFSLRED